MSVTYGNTMNEIDICNKLLRLLGGPEAVEMFLAAPQPLLRGECPETLLDVGRVSEVAHLVDSLEIRLG